MKTIFSVFGVVAMVCITAWLPGCRKPMAAQEVARAETPLGQPAAANMDAAAGKAIYDSRCADCHQLGQYDTDGNADDLAGQRSRLTKKFLARHNGDGLNTVDIANLCAFIARQ